MKDAVHHLILLLTAFSIWLMPAGADDEKKTSAAAAVAKKSSDTQKARAQKTASQKTASQKAASQKAASQKGAGQKATATRGSAGKTAEAKAGPKEAGNKKADSPNTTARTTRPSSRPAINKLPAADVESAMDFAREHHPELARLLEKLRGKSDIEFHRGVREVHTAAARLERYREKQPARFESGLRDWKRDSEIRLLSAKWIVSGDDKLEKRIQQLLRDRMESRIETMKAERKRLAARLEQLEQQINMDTAEMEAALTAEWERLSRRGTATNRAKNGERKPPARKTDKQKKTE